MILGPHTITRLRARAATDPYSGEAIGQDWTAPSQLDIDGCSVQPPTGLALLEDRRAGVITDYIVWAPLDADVTESDQVLYSGVTYKIARAIQRWDFSGLGHLVLRLQRVEG